MVINVHGQPYRIMPNLLRNIGYVIAFEDPDSCVGVTGIMDPENILLFVGLLLS